MSKLPPITEKSIHECIDPFTDLCEALTLGYPSAGLSVDDMTKIVEGTLKKNVKRMRAIHLLVDESHELAGPAYEIARNMIEDAVNLEYIQLPDRSEEFEMEYLVERFFDFQWIQLQQDLEYYELIGIPVVRNATHGADEIERKSAAMIQKYSARRRGFTDGTHLAHSWLRKGVEQLLAEIKAARPHEAERTEFIGRAYIRGNRSTHFNPKGVLEELQLETDRYHGRSFALDAYEAFIVGGLCLVWILRVYLDWIPFSGGSDYDKLEAKLNDVEEYLAYCVANVTKLPHDHI